MADIDNIVLEHLRHIRGAIDDMRGRYPRDQTAVGYSESQYASLSTRLDRMDVRIDASSAGSI